MGCQARLVACIWCQALSTSLNRPSDTNFNNYWKQREDLLKNLPKALRNDVAHAFDRRICDQIESALSHQEKGMLPLQPWDRAKCQIVFQTLSEKDPTWVHRFLVSAPPLLGVTAQDVLSTSRLEGMVKDWDLSDSVMTGIMAGVGPILLLEGIGMIGFGALGVVGGSLAASWQAAIGNVAAGSVFAQFQSMAALGALTLPWAFGAIAVGGVGYGVYKWATTPSHEERLVGFLKKLRDDRDKRDKFWGSVEL